MRKNGLLIAFFVCLSIFYGVISCTYDYFEDETNYQVFVPEVLDHSITDCRILIYTEDGVLVRERYAAYPWGKDPREQAGLFSFKLMPGTYNVFCYTNTDNITFSDVNAMETVAFHLNERSTRNNVYIHPSDILFQQLTPVIVQQGVLVIDTAAVERYTGRITVRFKDFPIEISNIKNVRLDARQVGVKQKIKDSGITACRISNEDVMYHFGELPTQNPSWRYLEVDHVYFPTVNDGGIATLEYTFLDSSGATILKVPIDLADNATGQPIVLRSNERIIIEVDPYIIIGISIVGWSQEVHNTDTDM